MSCDRTQVEDRLQRFLRQSFRSIESDGGSNSKVVTEQEIKDWATLICNSMTTPARVYHSVDHVFEVLDNLESDFSLHNTNGTPDPISRLAVLFHDIVYYSLDQYLSPDQCSLLKDVIKEDEIDGKKCVSLIPFGMQNDPAVAMVASIYDMPDKGPLPALGTNEFLSALVAIRTLGHVLSRRQLLQLAVGIEATVPFRAVDKTTNKSAMDRLYDRSLEVYSTFASSGLDDEVETRETIESVVKEYVHQAVIVANNDLGAFSSSDPTTFIDSNWSLLPEWFPILLDVHHCALSEYQLALASVRQRTLDPCIIFPSFRGIPGPSILAEKRRRAKMNISFLQDYIAIRTLTMIILIELAARTWSDTILKLADLRKMEQAAVQNGSLATNKTPTWNNPLDALIFQVLKTGRQVGYSWDAEHSPLAAALFVELGGSNEVSRLLEQHEAVDNSIDAWLGSQPKTVVLAAEQGVSMVLPQHI